MTNVNARPPQAILEDYAAIARRRPGALEATALRTRSRSLRDLFAYLITDGQLDFNRIAHGERSDQWDARWAAALGRVVGLQNLDEGDIDLAIDLLDSAANLPGKPRARYLRLRAELLFAESRFVEYARLLEEEPILSADNYSYLRTDLLNPFSGSPFADEPQWRDQFAAMFEIHGAIAPTLSGDAPNPFDRLTGTSAPGSVREGPLISVIMTTFKPRVDALTTSVRSILNQTWANLELLIVDDASPMEYRTTIHQLAGVDDRIRVHHMPENGGTYLARNAGIQLARGAIVTGQDDDDWSHPERLERQFAALTPGVAATQSWSIRIGSDLVFQRPGYGPARLNESSLMTRRQDLLAIGGYTPSRKGADTELKVRLETAVGPIAILRDVLAVIRFESTSLSRADFGAGWRHPARHAFRDAYMYWHENSSPADLALDISSRKPILPVPDRFAITSEDREYDVVLAGDWRSYGGPQRSMIEEISALHERGLSIGIMHLEAARFMTTKDQRLCDPIRDLVARGIVRRVLIDDPHRIRVMVLRYPPILQFPPSVQAAIKPDRLIILANQAPSERDGSDVRYHVLDVDTHAAALFGVKPLWVPQGPTVRHTIEDHASTIWLADYDLPGILDVEEWRTERSSYRSTRPVIGRHSRDDAMKWPDSRDSLVAAYPIADDDVEVRIMGGTRAASRVLGHPAPASWLSFAANEMDVRTFLNSIDFFVYHQHVDAYDAFGRAVLEALAAGCVAILPRNMEETFGDAALYATPEESMKLVRRYYGNPKAYFAQSERAVQRVAERFSRASYVDRVLALLA